MKFCTAVKYCCILHGRVCVMVDFSYNKLYRMRSEHTWADLFKHKLNLTDINLSYNQLEHLPLNTFSSNLNLKYIRLGGNKFHQITFDITKLVNLQLLNLQLNRIEFFETGSIGFLDFLVDNQQRSGTNTNISDRLHVVLQGNPLTCACVAKDFLRWMIDSPTFPNQQLHVLSCKATDSKMQITYAAVEEATNDCARPQRMRVTILLSSALSIISLIALVLVAYNLYKRRKRRLLHRQYVDRVRLLREDGLGFRYPVFLSYSSDDRDFVLYNILRPLRVTMRHCNVNSTS